MSQYEVPRSQLPRLPQTSPPNVPILTSDESEYEDPPLKRTDSSRKPFLICSILLFLLAISLLLYFFLIPHFLLNSDCSPGYQLLLETGFCYKVINSKSSFAQADEFCKSENAHLVSIHSRAENKLLADMARKSEEVYPALDYAHRLNEQDEVIIGLFFKEGKWQWSDGSKVDYVNWGPGEPNNLEFETSVTLVTSKVADKNPHGLLWNNIWKESSQRAFICKKGTL